MDDKTQQAFEARSRALFEQSVDELDMRVRSRLTQARHAALAGAAPRLPRRAWWMPAAGVAAAAVLGVSLWVGSPASHHGVSLADAQNTFEDLDIVAAADDGSADALDMLRDDDVDFYDFADKAAGADSAA